MINDVYFKKGVGRFIEMIIAVRAAAQRGEFHPPKELLLGKKSDRLRSDCNERAGDGGDGVLSQTAVI